MSASYGALVSWLLSLVAMDTDVIVGGESATAAPFRVIGLQQMLLDGQLALQVAVVPGQQFSARGLRSRPKVSCFWQILYSVVPPSLFCSLAVLDPRVGHTMDVLSPFIPVLCHSD